MALSSRISQIFLFFSPWGFGLLIFLSYAHTVNAANACTSTGTGNWNTVGTWTGCGGGTPTSLDSVTILTGHIVTVDTAAVADSVVINANASALGNGISIGSGQSLTVTGAVTLNIPTVATTDLNVDGGSLTAASIAIPGSSTANRFATVSVNTGTVTVSGSITFSGSATRARYTSTGTSMTNIGVNFGAGGTLTTSSTGTFNFNGSSTQVIGAYTTYNNVEINNSSGGVSFGGVATIGGTLLVNAGSLDVDGSNLVVTGQTTVNGILRISSVTGTKTFGDIIIGNGGVMDFTAPEAIAGNGNLTLNGTGAITGTTGLWTFQKVGGGTIGGTATSTTSFGSATFATNYSSGIPLTVVGNATVNAGIIFTNNSTFTVTGTLAGPTGTFTQGIGSILNIGAVSSIGTLDASASANEVHYTRTTGAQTIHAGIYHHLFIDKLGQVGTLGGAITVNGNLMVTAGNISDGGFQITGNASGILTIPSGSTLTLGIAGASTNFPTAFTQSNISLGTTSIVNYNSSLAQSISHVPIYGNLTLTTTGAVTKIASGNLTVNGLFTNGANNNFSDGGFIITLKDGIVMTGTYTGAGKILFTGGSALHTISGAGSYNNVELDDVNGLLQSGTTNIGGNLTITNGSWSPDGVTLTVTGTTLINGTLSFPSTGGVKTFGNIIINSGGAMNFTAAEALTVNGDLTVNGTGAITGTSGTWTFQKVGGGTIGGTVPALTIAGGTTFSTLYSILMPFTVNTMTVGTGISETNTSTITVNTLLAGAGTFIQAASSVLNLGGNSTITTLDASASLNEVHYTSTTAAQTIKATNYRDLFIEKGTQTATVSSSTNVLGNLKLTSGVLSLGSSILTVTGTTDIFGTIQDLNNSGSATFDGLVTVHTGGNWSGNIAEACDFNFQNGFSFDGTNFVTGSGVYTFLGNNQSITGSSPISVQNLAVTGIQLTNSSTAPLSTTNLSGTGEFIQDVNSILNINGTSTITTLTAIANGNSVGYKGSAAQNIRATTYSTLNVSSNTVGTVYITADTTVNTALILGSTIFSATSSTLIMGQGSTISRTSGFIDGSLQKNIPTGSASQSFEIGSGSDYTPVNISFNAVTVSGDLRVNSTPTDHPNIETSNLLADRTVNRFYTLTNYGVGFDTYDISFTFAPSDLDPGADISNFVLEKFDSGTWVRPTLGNVETTSISGKKLTSFSDFEIGELKIIPPTAVSSGSSSGFSLLARIVAAIPGLPSTGSTILDLARPAYLPSNVAAAILSVPESAEIPAISESYFDEVQRIPDPIPRPISRTTLFITFAILMIMCMLLLSHALIRNHRRLYLILFDYSGIPGNIRTFYEILSDTIMEMRKRVGDEALFVASHIEGLKIDTGTGRILDLTLPSARIIASLVLEYETHFGKRVSFTFRDGRVRI